MRTTPSFTRSPETLTAGALGLKNSAITETMSLHFTVNRTTFRNSPAWRLEQREGPEVLPFAVHHRKAKQAMAYARELAGDLMRCVLTVEGRHRVVLPAKVSFARQTLQSPTPLREAILSRPSVRA